MKDKNFIEMILKELVENPNDVVVDRIVDEMGVLLTVKVNQADMGLVIGKAGSTAQALRSLVRIIGMKSQSRVNLKIIDPRRINNVDESYNEAKNI